jgi:hypothetical protein
MQQAHGNAYVSRLVGPRGGNGRGLSRQPAPFPLDKSPFDTKPKLELPDWGTDFVGPPPRDQPFDMDPTNWGPMAQSGPIRGAALPESSGFTLPATPPKIPWRSIAEMGKNPDYARLQHPAHGQSPPGPWTPEGKMQQRRLEYWREGEHRYKYEEMRPKAWDALQQDLAKLRSGYGRAQALSKDFAEAQQDKTLQSPEIKFQPAPKDSAGMDLPSLAGEQVVPSTNEARVKVDDLFKGGREGKGETADLAMGGEERRGIERASKAGRISRGVDKVESAEKGLSAAVDDYAGLHDAVVAQGQQIEAAAAGMQRAQAQADVTQAGRDLAEAQAKRDEAKAAIGTFLSVSKSLLLLGVGIPGAKGGAAPNTLKGMVSGNVEPIGTSSDLIGIIAGAIIDSRYAAEIEAAESKLKASVDAFDKSTMDEATKKYAAEVTKLASETKKLSAAKRRVEQQYIERRIAYETLGESAAGASGVSKTARERICAYVAAVPVADVVLTRAGQLRAVLDQAVDIPYTDLSGRAYTMAMKAGMGDGGLVGGLKLLRGHRDHVSAMEQFWGQRLVSLRQVIAELGGGVEGGRGTGLPEPPK